MIGYGGTVRGFREHALREIRKAAMAGLTLQGDSARIQRMLMKAMTKDLADRTARRGRVA